MSTKRSWPFTIAYTILVILWLVMMVGGLIYTFRTAFSGQSYAFVFTIMLLVGLFILYRFGRFLWRQWAYWTATREIMFINQEELILRRPISIWGNTDAYDMEHVDSFYLDGESENPTFDYGYRHIVFGEALDEAAAGDLVNYLSERFNTGAFNTEQD